MITLTIQSKCLVFLKAGLIALLLSASWGQAQTQWPSKAVTLVVPFAPGAEPTLDRALWRKSYHNFGVNRCW